MKIANYRLWFGGGSTCKGLDFVSLILKDHAKCGDPKPLADAMKSYHWAEYLNIRGCALEESKLFGSTKWQLDLPPGVDCDSHRPYEVTYLIACPNIRGLKACIEESLISTKHGVAYTTLVLETDLLSSHWHIAKLLPNSAKRCWVIQVHTWTCAMPKSELGNMVCLLPRTWD